MDLPGIRLHCTVIADDLCSGRSVFWVMPEQIAVAPMVDSVVEQCVGRDRSVKRFDTVDPGIRSLIPGLALCQSLGLDASDLADCSPASLIGHPEFPDIVVIEALTPTGDVELQRWKRFVGEWSRAATLVEPPFSQRALLIVANSDSFGVPTDDVRLAVRRLWGHLSGLDLELFARRSSGGQSGLTSWPGMVGPELAGSDLGLLDELLSNPPCDGSVLDKLLTDYGTRLGWTRGLLTRLNAANVLDSGYWRRVKAQLAPPVEAEPLWRIGALSYTPESGMELHSSAAALLERRDIIDHRIWRGEVRILMPLLDSLRRDICAYLTRQVGPGWVDYAAALHPEDIQGTPERPLTQFGHLANIAVSTSLPLRIRQNLANPLRFIKDIRNSLAHFAAIGLADFDRVLDVVKALEPLR